MKACTVCSLELEDSYLFCPEDGASLAEPADGSTSVAAAADSLSRSKRKLTSLDLIRPEIDRPQAAAALTVAKRSYGFSNLDACSIDNNHNESDGDPAGSIFQGIESDEPEQRRFRVAAIATIIALALFALAGLYALVSGLSRRPSHGSSISNQTEAAQPAPFVITPQEAQDYKEEPPAPPVPDNVSQPPAVEQVAARAHKESSPSSNEQRDKKPVLTQSVSPLKPTTPNPVSNPPLPDLPRASSAGFDSRLVRARANRTASGYRYDLTFNMQEQRGRAAHWQRVLITTRSANGMNHSQALPFVHRLGGTGALTFTISVELTGRSEADWRGRVNCTALGWDNSGAPLQASFVANVNP